MTGKKREFGGRFLEEHEIFLNLTPMIDVLTTLLFFLLLSFGSVIIALINASVPVQADSSSTADSNQTAVTMGLSVTKQAIKATASNDSLSEAELKKMDKVFPANKDGYDYEGLNQYLYDVKRKFKKSETVIITPDPEIPYDTLIKVMDASRERTVTMNRRTYKLPLFPGAVISTIVK